MAPYNGPAESSTIVVPAIKVCGNTPYPALVEVLP
jgi:hypothetical protein